eukprot:gnl/TRDRNA2_/TRDRNA2_80695_c0_seq1.p1 gnl/TRDRNA2_/TRDRNA2_80695_c0~~gnl/TRDRNA2_/TRDRNA2_80695_c0_seq1.p1  ORF type:complete len:445 (-),score=92.94 gnl/TRDRNA2_/TRDRNA2_80695_c0_seq1:149-1483(-)
MAATSLEGSLKEAWASRDMFALASETAQRYDKHTKDYLGMRAGMQPSEREVQARASRSKDVAPIVMTAGMPDSTLLPYEDLKNFVQKGWEKSHPAPLQYGASQLLKEEIAKYLTKTRGREVASNEIHISCGNGPGLKSVFNAYLNPGDVAIVESPLWTMTVDLIKQCGANVISVGTDKDGILVDDVEQHILAAERDQKRIKLIYLQPLNHNPTGRTITRAKAEKMLRLAAKHGSIIVCDEAYEPFWYGPKPCHFSALSGGHGVCSVHTFSKTLGTGLRLGWVHASPETLKPLQTLNSFGMDTSVFLQYAVGELLASGRFEEIIARAKSVYTSKAKVICDALTKFAGRHLAVTPSVTGGFFVWLELKTLPAFDVYLQMLAVGVEARFGGNMYGPNHTEFDIKGSPSACHIGLSFVGPTEENLVEAAKRMGAACDAVEAAGQKSKL